MVDDQGDSSSSGRDELAENTTSPSYSSRSMILLEFRIWFGMYAKLQMHDAC
ncbi:hypothetical protein COLO4_32732 [Corchorus olitorius]|uniref:Uncharacterized protein n=1 Tax=Corchorus olitorius TaxID=93759 RepID=A0A1R3GYK6_9ROSI|nr:hypothetical protein COLO4_32732 [Corchorus olitorius]